MKKLKLSKNKKSAKPNDGRQTLLSVRRLLESSTSKANYPRPAKRQFSIDFDEAVDDDKESIETEPKKLRCNLRSATTVKPHSTGNHLTPSIANTNVEDEVCLIDSDESRNSQVNKISSQREKNKRTIDSKSQLNDFDDNLPRKCTLCDEEINCREYDVHFRNCFRSRYERKPSANELSPVSGISIY